MVRYALLFLIVGVLLNACAHVETRLPVPTAALLTKETADQEKQAFARYETQLKRLDRISAKILRANADICTKTRQDFGVRTHVLKSYSKYLRGAAGRQLGAGKTPSVLLVRSDLGIVRSDIILGYNDKPLGVHSKILQASFTDSQARLKIKRGESTVFVDVKAKPACDYPVNLRMSGTVNAYATGKSIIVTTAMMDFAKTDEQLALVVGHELAHNTMGHIHKTIQNMILSGFATRTTRPFEAEADYVGLYYMARSGYKLNGVEEFWRALGVKNPKNIVRAKTHPVTPARLLSIRMAAQEIKDKQLRGEKLMPNMLGALRNIRE